MAHLSPNARAAWPAALFFACSFASAQSAPGLQEVVVTASRTEQRVRDALPATTLITREQIERAQTPDLPTLLRSVAGTEITQNGGAGTVSSAFLRGAESRHTLVLIDGVPVNNLNFGTAAIEHLPLADVERIEIVRGNVSSLYGSAAMGGVIQIFTRQASGTPQAAFSAQGGSRNTSQGSASGSVKLPSGTGLRATVEAMHDGGFNATRQDQRPGTNPDRDPYSRRSGSFTVTQDLNRDSSVGLTVREARGNTHYDSQFGPATQEDISKFIERGAHLSGRLRVGALKFGALVGRSEDRLDAAVTAVPFFVNSRSNTGQVSADWEFAQGQHLTTGLEQTRQELQSDTAYSQSRRTLNSARLGYTFDAVSHQLQLNARRDRYSDFGDATTWLAAYAYRLTETWRIKAQASTGFNAPTFNDLYFPFGGNPDLRPEKVKSAEIGLQYAVGDQEMRVTLFQNRFTDLIASDIFFTRMNIGHARTRGLEVTYTGRVLDTAVNAAFTRQNPDDLDSGQQLTRRARTLASISLDRDLGRWQLGGRARYSGERLDPPNRLGAYAVFDATGSYRLSPELRLFARVENLFDKDYQTVFGYNQPGRGVFVGLDWKPKF